MAMERDAKELARLFKEELLPSEPFRQATVVAGVAGKAADRRGVPDSEEAQLN